MPLLSIESVTIRFPKLEEPALNSVSLKVDAGEITALIGPNGSGKTTLLNITAGLLEPDEGKVLLEGKQVQGPATKLVPGHEEIKLVHQDFGLKPNMNVNENIRYQLLDYDLQYQKERLEEVLELCNLKELRDRKPRELSGGQQQRVSLANALASDPKLLLMDEPFSNLDPVSKEVLFSEVRNIARETLTAIIIVTHDASDALSISDSISFLEGGKIVQADSGEKIYANPASLHIARFLGFVSVLDADSRKRLKIPEKNGKITAVRAENIIPDESGAAFTIQDIANRGFYQILFLKQQEGDPLMMIDYPGRRALGQQKAGSTINIRVDPGVVLYY